MPLSTGQVIYSRYRIVKLIAHGGFGAVYRAWDLSLKGPCAVKENYDTTPEAQSQFECEASLLFNLRHPNLPRVYDHFVIPSQGQYLVMDLIAGEDLEQILKQKGPLLERQAVEWILQICDALTYLHSRQPSIIHRDIKPANIRVTPEGRAMLVDFGIAKSYDPLKKTAKGARGVMLGYSPPEQYGQGGTDARSDIYALGATLYTLLTCQIPPDSIALLNRNAPPLKSARQHNQRISARVSDTIQKAMQLKQAERFKKVSDFQKALQPGWQKHWNWQLVGIGGISLMTCIVLFIALGIYMPWPIEVATISPIISATPSPSLTATPIPYMSSTPSPTITVSPTSTLTATPSILYLSNFSTPNDAWEQDGRNLGYENGRYFIFIDEGHIFAYELLEEQLFRNASVEVDAWGMDQTPGGYGIIVRYREEVGFYLVRVDSSQQTVELIEYRYEEEHWKEATYLSYYKPEVIKGVGEMNRLQVVFQGEQIKVLVNDIMVAIHEDAEDVEGMIGLYNCTCGGDGQAKSYFDNLVITTP